jgi:hypothetical protein
MGMGAGRPLLAMIHRATERTSAAPMGLSFLCRSEFLDVTVELARARDQTAGVTAQLPNGPADLLQVVGVRGRRHAALIDQVAFDPRRADEEVAGRASPSCCCWVVIESLRDVRKER